MAELDFLTDEELRCEEKCVYEYVECVEAEDGASIYKTRERNCFNDCKW
jgi:hypothetical protein